MRASVIRRSAVAASAVSFALLLTACGGGEKAGDGDKGAAKDATSAAPAAPAAKVLTAAELEKAVLAQGDVKGHKVQPAGADEVGKPGSVTVDKAECLPLAEASSGVALGKSTADVTRKVMEEPKAGAEKPSFEGMTEKQIEEALASTMAVTVTIDKLASYEAKGAADALASLRAAATACAGGFTLTQDGEKTKIVKVTEAKVSGGDEAGAWVLAADMEDGDTMAVKVAAVRQGSTLATFTAVNIGAAVGGKDFPLPTAVIDAQVAKVAKQG
ncbi:MULTISPECIES: hypothetical protein [Streptomyces]|uniref:PknH-like extracellular domain-containing protein n=2 Tax=Streptomyces TaxID=1883 RepID=A0A117IVM7_9ACTN|nr:MULTISPECIES: hypothetical protein [Streptomyces]KUH37593.1 hypothetical protein ATE80_17475 [Streptomyces kanasensis]UUS32533.1 hypothetical protein NRO40_18095 [Streptomyces changanensis]